MPHLRLTEVAVERMKPHEARTEYWDTITSGLVLRVMPTGHKSWCFAYRVKGLRKQERLTFGTFPDISVSTARDIARSSREDTMDTSSLRMRSVSEKFLMKSLTSR